MPRSTSIRRGPIRKDWNKSRAINCGVTACIGQVLLAFYLPQTRREHKSRIRRDVGAWASFSVRKKPPRIYAAAFQGQNLLRLIPTMTMSADQLRKLYRVRDRVDNPQPRHA